MAVLLSLLASLGYGTSDFLAGTAGRRGQAAAVALLAQPLGLAAALLGLVIFRWAEPTFATLGWGAVSGVGSGLGTLALYRGLARGRMAVVAPLSAVLTAAIPAVAGLAMGNRPGGLALVGIVLALPAVALVSRASGGSEGSGGVVEGLLAGACFALLFIGLDRAGTHSGTWPLVTGQSVSVALIALNWLRGQRPPGGWGRIAPLALAAGALSGSSNILFLEATGHGPLAVVAVLASLYPATTVLLARVVLRERWTRLQGVGLAVAVAAVVMISA
ncbi:MAG: EamA family transporter [Candidatus Dormibacteria bacterium]